MKKTIKTQLFDALAVKFPNNEFRYTDIIRTLIEDVRGQRYNHKTDRGHYACNIQGPNARRTGYLCIPSKNEKRYLQKVGKLWTVANFTTIEDDNVILEKPKYQTVFIILNGIVTKGLLYSSDNNNKSRVSIEHHIAPVLVNTSDLFETEETAKKHKITLEKELEEKKIKLRREAWRTYTLELKRIDNLK